MGSMKENWMDHQGDAKDAIVANLLGVSLSEFYELEPVILPQPNVGGTETGAEIKLNNTSNEELINKLRYKPDADGTIYLDIFDFSPSEDDEELGGEG